MLKKSNRFIDATELVLASTRHDLAKIFEGRSKIPKAVLSAYKKNLECDMDLREGHWTLDEAIKECLKIPDIKLIKAETRWQVLATFIMPSGAIIGRRYPIASIEDWQKIYLNRSEQKKLPRISGDVTASYLVAVPTSKPFSKVRNNLPPARFNPSPLAWGTPGLDKKIVRKIFAEIVKEENS